MIPASHDPSSLRRNVEWDNRIPAFPCQIGGPGFGNIAGATGTVDGNSTISSLFHTPQTLDGGSETPTGTGTPCRLVPEALQDARDIIPVTMLADHNYYAPAPEMICGRKNPAMPESQDKSLP